MKLKHIAGSKTITEQQVSELEGALMLGMDLRSACYFIGVSPFTVENLIKGGYYDETSNSGALLMRLRSAVAQLEGRMLQELNLTHVSGKPAEYKQVIDTKTTMPDGSIVETYTWIKTKDEVKPNPLVAQWILSRRFKQKWGDKLDILITKDAMEDSPLKANEINVTDEESRRKVLKRIAESLPDDE
jgi:hypothetical protein